MPPHLVAALVGAVVAGGLGGWVPALIARIPEPQPVGAQPVAGEVDAAEGDRSLFSRALPPAPPKVPYAHIATTRGLLAGAVVASALLGAVLGAAIGLGGSLLVWLPLVPVGVALAVVDWRVHLLPTWVLHRAYVALAVLVLLATVVDRDVHALYRAAGGWLLIGGFYFLLHLIGGMGFGDVRLARLIGPALGFLGWSEVVVGLLAIVLLAGVGAVVAAVALRSVRARIPYGPYIMVGALVGVVAGPGISSWYLVR